MHIVATEKMVILMKIVRKKNKNINRHQSIGFVLDLERQSSPSIRLCMCLTVALETILVNRSKNFVNDNDVYECGLIQRVSRASCNNPAVNQLRWAGKWVNDC
jgi:hypothetical protein